MYKVLVCDDEAILESLRIYLTQSGYQVVTASDGIEALEIIAKVKCKQKMTGKPVIFLM